MVQCDECGLYYSPELIVELKPGTVTPPAWECPECEGLCFELKKKND